MPDAPNLTTSTRRPALSPIERGRTTTDEVEERLILAIATGDKAFGDRITEAEIATALKVSRVPAREAMKNLLLRGVLVEGEQRGLRVSDYSAARVAELFELRLAIEKIILVHAMREGHDREPMLRELEGIVDRMRSLSGSGDVVALSSVDLDFHRTVARYSGNELAAQIWEGLAQHLLIVFCRDWSNASDRTGEVRLHETMIDFIRSGSLANLEAVLELHFSEPARRS